MCNLQSIKLCNQSKFDMLKNISFLGNVIQMHQIFENFYKNGLVLFEHIFLWSRLCFNFRNLSTYPVKKSSIFQCGRSYARQSVFISHVDFFLYYRPKVWILQICTFRHSNAVVWFKYEISAIKNVWKAICLS